MSDTHNPSGHAAAAAFDFFLGQAGLLQRLSAEAFHQLMVECGRKLGTELPGWSLTLDDPLDTAFRNSLRRRPSFRECAADHCRLAVDEGGVYCEAHRAALSKTQATPSPEFATCPRCRVVHCTKAGTPANGEKTVIGDDTPAQYCPDCVAARYSDPAAPPQPVKLEPVPGFPMPPPAMQAAILAIEAARAPAKLSTVPCDECDSPATIHRGDRSLCAKCFIF